MAKAKYKRKSKKRKVSGMRKPMRWRARKATKTYIGKRKKRGCSGGVNVDAHKRGCPKKGLK